MSDKKIPQAGARKARLNRYIIAGEHTVPGYEGAPDKDAPQIILGWELSEDFTDEDTPRPMWIKPFGHGNINDYDGEKAKKTKWFSNMFLEYSIGDDAASYLGRGCRVVIKHNKGKGKFADRTFANLSDVRDYDGELPPLSKPAVFFDFYNPTAEGVKNLMPWELDYLKSAIDYRGSKLERLLGEDTVAESTPSDDTGF